ncbi:hypothetical protein Back2_10420 [Nocardioides baekrokdamisoli]|uniref:Uncharacterized protein n=1 Tax=Nocardioides baekrokdamisoli TaxID=1804624 RepID=A0A3G9IL68_9ACTN|nr:hypothetical protein [Nocardioides baekrokdamisoli]BBH16755.1 hypothetical protein Back2_10420 [Nocardioides baekrokdamisoli]
MGERVVPSGINIEWDPNVPDAVMVSNDFGVTALAVAAHPSDSDERNVVLLWRGVAYSTFGAPNDEALAGHPLWDAGLRTVLWLGLVQDSSRIHTLAAQNAVHSRHDPGRYDLLEHYIAPLKECLIEVVARSVEVSRHGGSTLDAATTALSR